MLVDLYVKEQQGMDIFTEGSNIMDYGVMWISLDSFWRHPFTAEDPLLSKWCNATFLLILSNRETNSSTSWMGWAQVYFQQLFIFGWNITLNLRLNFFFTPHQHEATNNAVCN